VLTCPRCGGELEEGDTRCEQCGHVLAVSPAGEAAAPAEAPGARRLMAGLGCGMLVWRFALIAIVALFGLLLGGLVGAAPGAWV
jgi:uncharacterized membrane protein YvbJ